MSKQAIKLVNLSKIWEGGLKANNRINFDLNYGEIHAIFGENGAGKSTMMKMIFGETSPSEGEIYINEQKIVDHNPKIAISSQMGMVHQHFNLINNFSVFENLILGYEFRNQNDLQKLNDEYHRRLAKVNQWQKKELEDEKFTVAEIKKKYQKKIFKLQLWKEKKVISFSIGGKKMMKQIQAIKKKFDLNLNNKQKVKELSTEKLQRIEILKVLLRYPKILIFDEPTSLLNKDEIKEFLDSLKKYRAEGKAIIFITHKIDEIRKIADRVSVLRYGKMIGTFTLTDVTNEKLIKLMIGEKKVFSFEEIQRNPVSKEILLEVINLNKQKQDGRYQLRNINFNLYKGEILGIAGIENNGQKTLLEILAGIDNKFTGQIYFDSPSSFFALRKSTQLAQTKQTWNQLGVQALRQAGISYISSDRLEESLIKNEPLYENLSFNYLFHPELFKSGFFQHFKRKNARYIVDSLVEKYNLQGIYSAHQPATSLSGGNQQKFVIARELWGKPALLLANNPTWGIDVFSIGALYKIFIEQRNIGYSTIMVSYDFHELLNLADRVLVISRGEIVGEVCSHDSRAAEKIAEFMTIKKKSSNE